MSASVTFMAVFLRGPDRHPVERKSHGAAGTSDIVRGRERLALLVFLGHSPILARHRGDPYARGAYPRATARRAASWRRFGSRTSSRPSSSFIASVNLICSLDCATAGF